MRGATESEVKERKRATRLYSGGEVMGKVDLDVEKMGEKGCMVSRISRRRKTFCFLILYGKQ